MGNICQIQWLGRMDYLAAAKLQRELAVKRATGLIPNTLLLMEHPHTFAIGSGGHREQLLTSHTELERLNITCHQVDRTGAVMYHGPGQLVVCPILSLQECKLNYHTYAEQLEKVIIQTLRTFNIHAFRQPGQRGVWVLPTNSLRHRSRWQEAEEQVARVGLIGIKVDPMHITSHGFAINVSPDLKYFDLIVPRGIQGCKATSLQFLLNRPVKIKVVIQPVINSFCNIFNFESQLINLLPGESEHHRPLPPKMTATS